MDDPKKTAISPRPSKKKLTVLVEARLAEIERTELVGRMRSSGDANYRIDPSDPTVLSGERVSQMTKTYADVDAVQRLLEEKEKDLELAARIGQQLLEQNRVLEERCACLEAENKDITESLTQIKHELAFKTQLIEIYNENPPSEDSSKAGTPIGSVATVLERRVAMLEEENSQLRSETSRMAEDVEKTEADEKYLVEDAIKRLSETNSRVTRMSDDLQKKTDENIAQQEELVLLVDELKAVEEINHEFFEENRELRKLVDGLKGSQDELSTELIDLKDNYMEVVAILKETQEQLREAQKRRDSGADAVSVFDSLAYEIESSVARQRHSSDYFRRCFDTVRCANSKLQSSSSSVLSQSSQLMSSTSSGYHSGLPSLDTSSCASGGSGGCSQEMMILMNPASLSMTSSDLGSSICASPSGSTPSDSSKYSWRIPEKLQIVKPLEGSSTLQVWSTLATPHLGNLLDRRPGIHMRVERPVGEIGMLNVLSLTEGDCTTLQNFTSTTPAVLTFVTTSTNWPPVTNTDSTTIVYSSGDITSSKATLTSVGSPRTTTTTASADLGTYMKELQMCETPQNSPADGNTRPGSPVAGTSTNQTLKTLYGFYDSLLCKLGGLGNSGSLAATANGHAIRDFGSPKKYDLMSKINSVEVARQAAPAKPGTGALNKIFESQQ